MRCRWCAETEISEPGLAKVRRAAKEAGWGYVRDPGSIRGLDKDLCPKHNPAPPAATEPADAEADR
jgi:hypothetical protein